MLITRAPWSAAQVMPFATDENDPAPPLSITLTGISEQDQQ